MSGNIKTRKTHFSLKHFVLTNNRQFLVTLVYLVLLIFFIVSITVSGSVLERQVSLYAIIGVFTLLSVSLICRNRSVNSVLHLIVYPLLFVIFIFLGIFIPWVLLFCLLLPLAAFILLDNRAALWPVISMAVLWLGAGIFNNSGVITSQEPIQYFWVYYGVYLLVALLSGFQSWFLDYQMQTALKNLYFDKLTGLPNRHKYLDEIASIPDPFVILLDIDSFIEINEGFGASVGNQIIRDVVKEFTDTLFNLDFRLYRLHSDDFLIVFPHQGANANFDYKQIATQLIRNVAVTRFAGTVDNLRYDVHITISAGMTRAPEYDYFELLTKADTALKNARKAMLSFQIFSSEQDQEHQFKDNMRWLNILTEAIQDNRVVPYFQPIFDNVSGKVSKHEALVRLIKPEGEVVSPYYFLGIAQKSRLYPRITQTMFNSVVKTITNSGTDISINLNIRDIFNTETTMIIENTLNRHPFVARHLIFELLETYQLEHSPQLASFIHEMKNKGVRFAIDDFGSGYSNYEYILRLNLDYLKIAGELVKDIHQIQESRILVENITSFARKLGIQTIAEFVHNAEVQEIIKEIGVDYSQGFYLGKPEVQLVLPK